MSNEATGRIILKGITQQVSEKFKKRQMVLEIVDGAYTNYADFQLSQKNCDLLDRFNEGDTVRVQFNLKGRKWEKDGKVSYFNSLDVYRVEPAAGVAAPSGQTYSQPNAQVTDNAPLYSANGGQEQDLLPF